MQVTVHDEAGSEIGRTFSRRARQLVSSSRAVWLDETHTAIRLISSGSKEEKMEPKSIIKEIQPNGGYTVADSYEADGLYDKDALLKLAKKRVVEKRKLRRHIIVYTLVFFFGLIAVDYRSIDAEFYLGCILTWGVFLIKHIAGYFAPYIKNGGIRNFFGRSYRDPVEAEYKKLKRMEPERIAAEYKRL